MDYVYNSDAVALYGWIFKVVSWDDVTNASNLKSKAEVYLNDVINQNITIELNAIDLHLLDRSIESFNVCDYVRVVSAPHNFDSTLLCNKQSLDLLKPDNDSLVLGYTYSTFTETNSKMSTSISKIGNMQSSITNISNKMIILNDTVENTSKDAETALENYQSVSTELSTVSGDLEAIAGVVTENARNIATNANNIATNAENITNNAEDITKIETDMLKINTFSKTIGTISANTNVAIDIPITLPDGSTVLSAYAYIDGNTPVSFSINSINESNIQVYVKSDTALADKTVKAVVFYK